MVRTEEMVARRTTRRYATLQRLIGDSIGLAVKHQMFSLLYKKKIKKIIKKKVQIAA